jgi:putative intracellular protease/amidase
MKKVLMVLTSHDRLGETGKPTGFWLEEFTTPYYVLKDAGVQITLASPLGGQPPLDPKSDDPTAQTETTERFRNDPEGQATLAHTHRLQEMNAADFDAVFYPGGHGPLWDLAVDPDSIALIEAMLASGKPVATVCHGPAVLGEARNPDGTPLVAGRQVTGFTNSEEEGVGLTAIVPFLVEDMLTAKGGLFSRATDWQPHAVSDGLLITGQNPASSEPVATALLEQLG